MPIQSAKSLDERTQHRVALRRTHSQMCSLISWRIDSAVATAGTLETEDGVDPESKMESVLSAKEVI